MDFNLAGAGCLVLKYKQQSHRDLRATGEKSTVTHVWALAGAAPGLLDAGQAGGGWPCLCPQPRCSAVDSNRPLQGEALRPFPCLLLRRNGDSDGSG